MASSRCYKCKSECVFKEDKQRTFGFPCDMCCLVICQNCNKTQAQEIRVVPSQTRTLVFLCPDCLINVKNLPNTLKEVKALTNKLNQLKLQFENMESSLNQQDTHRRLQRLEEQLIELKNSKDPNNKISELDAEVPASYSAITTSLIEEQFTKQQDQMAIKLDSVVNAIKESNVELVKFITNLSPTFSHSSKEKAHGVPQIKTTAPVVSVSSFDANNAKALTKGLSDHGNRQSRTSVIKGTNEKQLPISAAEHRKWIYVGNLRADCSEEMVKSHLTTNNVVVLSCDKLPSKQDHIASFKVSVPADSENLLLNAELWPAGVTIKPFMFPGTRRRTQYRNPNFRQKSHLQPRK